jgi:hypothetical protein
MIRPQAMQGLAGVVRWAAGEEAGIQFETPLYEPLARHLQETHSTCLPRRHWQTGKAAKS